MKTRTRHSLNWPRLRRGLLALGIAIGAVQGATFGQIAERSAVPSNASYPVGDHSSGLGEFLARKRAALLPQNASEGDLAPLTLRARTKAESRSGVRRLTIRDFQLLSDSARSLAGYSLGAGSWETEVGVLGSAVADEFVIQAAARNIPLDAIDVVFTSNPDDPSTTTATNRVNYPRNLRYTAYIVSSATDEQLEALRRAVEQVNPVLNLVAQSQDIAPGKLVYTQSPATVDPDAPPGLRDFLVEKRAALLRRQNAPRQPNAQPTASRGLRAHVTVEGRTGLRRLRLDNDTFQILHDSPRSLGGHDLGPTVEEHQLGVMTTCLTHIFEIQAALRQVTLDALEVSVEATLTPRIGAGTTNPPRYKNIQYSVHIASPNSAEEVDELRKAVEGVCPIYNLLKDSQPIEGRIVRERYRAGA